MLYNDKIGGKNLDDKQSVEQAMSQRRLVYKDSMQADLAEAERRQSQKANLKEKRGSKIGTSGFKATERGKHWKNLTERRSTEEAPASTRYKPKYTFVLPQAPSYSQSRAEKKFKPVLGGKLENNEDLQHLDLGTRKKRLLNNNLTRREQAVDSLPALTNPSQQSF